MVSGCNAQWSQMFVDENDGTTAVRVCYWEYIRSRSMVANRPFAEIGRMWDFFREGLVCLALARGASVLT